MPLGKGFYEFSFSSVEDLRKDWSVGSWNLETQILRPFSRSPDFNSSLVKQTNTQCWIRILGLPQEYWRPKIIYVIDRGIRVPLSLDDATTNITCCHYARVLVDIELNCKLRDQVLVEREGFAFFVGIEYERLPLCCFFCKSIGHSLSNCKKDPSCNQNLNGSSTKNNLVVKKRSVVQYVPKNKDVENKDVTNGTGKS